MVGLFLYRVGILGYGMLVRLVSFWHIKARLWVRGRKNWYQTIAARFSPQNAKVIWFHCASLGEFEQGRAVMERFKQLHPDWKLVITFYSPSGYEVRKNYAVADLVSYLPLDTPRNARKFITLIQPTVAVFVKYEFWYYYLHELSKRHIPSYLISAIFRREQAFFRRGYGALYRRWLLLFTGLMVQDQPSANLLAEYGIVQGVQVVGDSRFDRVWQAASQPVKPLEKVEAFCANAPVFVAGSTWAADEEYLRPVIDAMPQEWKCIVVPHEIHEANILDWLSRYASTAVRYTAESTPEELQHARVLLVDQVGILLSIYRYASLAYVGGGFGVGIHNTIEPAACGLPVCFGPNFAAFREARELITQGAALSLHSAEDFMRELLALMQNKHKREEMGHTAKEYVAANIGASGRIIATIEHAQLNQ